MSFQPGLPRSRAVGMLSSTDLGPATMKLYRVNKVAKPGGVVLKKKHILAASDNDAVRQAADSPDCPVCEVERDGKKVAAVL